MKRVVVCTVVSATTYLIDKTMLRECAIKRVTVRNMIETAAQRDMSDASVYDEYQIPKLYLTTEYCVSCAVHAHVVRARPRDNRRDRTPPVRVKMGEKKPDIGKPMKSVKRSARRVKRAIADN